jgi:ubiquitin
MNEEVRALPFSRAEIVRAFQSLRKRERKACAYCGREMEGLRRRRYCSDTCRSAAWQKTHRDRVNASRRRRQARQRPHAGTPTEPEPAP